MYQVLLFKSRRHLRKGSTCVWYDESLVKLADVPPVEFVFIFRSRLPLGKICHQRQVAD